MRGSLSRAVPGPSFRNRPSSAIILSFTSRSAEDENLPSNSHHEKPWWVKKTPLWARMKWFPSREHGRVVGRPQVARASRASWSTTGLSSHASTGLRMKLFSASVAATLPMSSMSTSGLYLGVIQGVKLCFEGQMFKTGSFLGGRTGQPDFS